MSQHALNREKYCSAVITGIAGLVLAFCVLPFPRVLAEPLPGEQGRVKAAMLVKLIDFVTWPPAAFEKSPKTFVIGVLGTTRMFDILKKRQGELVKGRRLKVVHLENWAPGTLVHLLYFDSADLKPQVVYRGRQRPVPILTVSDARDFLHNGGMIQFLVTENGAVRFGINHLVQSRSGISLGCALLKLAKIHKPAGRLGK